MYWQSVLADIYEYLIKCTAVPKLLNYGRVLSNSVGTGYIIVPDNTRYYLLVSEKNFCWKNRFSRRGADPKMGLLNSASGYAEVRVIPVITGVR